MTEDDFTETSKKAGKKIVSGLTKGGVAFTKHVSSGVARAQIKQSMESDSIEKVKIVGTEVGKGIIKGATESFKKGTPDLIDGVSKLGKAIGDKIKDIGEEA